MDFSEPSREAALDAFQATYARDAAAWSVRELSDYLALFPGDDLEIAHAYLELQGRLAESAAPTTAAVTPSSRRPFGRYQVFEEVGRGGQGRVYRARDTVLSREVALKILEARGDDATQLLSRFRREVAIVGRIDHPGICPVLDASHEGGVPFIAMPFLEGVSLARAVSEVREALESDRVQTDVGAGWARFLQTRSTSGDARAPIAAGRDREGVRAVVSLFLEASRALAAAHEVGVVHRDVKPGNIMVTREGRTVVLDFGLARDVAGEGLTRCSEVLGTPAYMAPERFDGAVVDPRCDTWALCASLYECLTLRRPFVGSTWSALRTAILEEEPVPASRLASGVPRDLAAILSMGLEKDPRRRYATARELADDLQRWLDGEPVHARPPGALRRGLRQVRRHPVLATCLIALGVVGVVALALIESRRSDEAAAFARTRAIQRDLDGVLRSVAWQLPMMGFSVWDLEGNQPGAFEDSIRSLEIALEKGLPFADRELIRRRLEDAWWIAQSTGKNHAEVRQILPLLGILEPDHPHHACNLAHHLEGQRRGVAHLTSWLERNGDHPKVLTELGRLLLRRPPATLASPPLEDVQRAVRYLRRACELSPRDRVTLAACANALLHAADGLDAEQHTRQKELAREAMGLLKRARAIQVDAQILHLLVAAHRLTRASPDVMLEGYRAAHERYQKEAPDHYNVERLVLEFGLFLVGIGRTDDAVRVVRERFRHGRPVAYPGRLAEFALELMQKGPRHHTAAEHFAERALDGGRLRPRGLCRVAWVLGAAGKPRDALLLAKLAIPGLAPQERAIIGRDTEGWRRGADLDRQLRARLTDGPIPVAKGGRSALLDFVEACWRCGRHEEARRWCREALSGHVPPGVELPPRARIVAFAVHRALRDTADASHRRRWLWLALDGAAEAFEREPDELPRRSRLRLLAKLAAVPTTPPFDAPSTLAARLNRAREAYEELR